jgi:hypothetical protein
MPPEPDEREMYPNGVREVLYRDPDSNELAFGGAPLTGDADFLHIGLCSDPI